MTRPDHELRVRSLFQVFIVTSLLLSKTRVVVAQDDQQCSEHRFNAPFFPGSSCEDIYNKNSQSRNWSGYYWITDGPSRVYCGMSYTGSSCEDIFINNVEIRDKSGYYRINNNEWVYCNMTAIAFSRGDLMSSCAGRDGVWKRIARFNITAGDDCPLPWVSSSNGGVSSCIGSIDVGCYSVNYSTNGMSYQRVCGRVNGYWKGAADAFGYHHSVTLRGSTIDSNYVDGLAITHGNDPRQHIWTYAVGFIASSTYNCPCAGGRAPPSFVSSHYYCQSGPLTSMVDLANVLWEGAGCPAGNTCCSGPDLPWFYRQLSQTTQDDIEVRSCRDENFANEAIFITNIELYIQ